jgi:hypothetical protein
MGDTLWFWTLVFTGATAAGWFLSVRPGARHSGVSAPVAVLTLAMAVMLCLLSATADGGGAARHAAYALLSGG